MFLIKLLVLLSGYTVYGIEYPHGLSNFTANYPEKRILAAVSKNSSFSSMFGDVFRPEMKTFDRFGEMGGKNVCPSRHITYRPTSGLNAVNSLRNIVNVDGYAQFVTVEVCEDDAHPSIDCLLSMGYEYTCETQHVNIRLVVYDEKTDGLALETFSVAAGCACTYKFEDF